METTLNVTPEALRSTAGSFSAKATQVKALHDSMLQKVSALNNSFTGEAATAYSTKFNALKGSMETIYAMIMEHAKDLNAICDKYIDTERVNTAAANELPNSTLG